MQEHPDRYSGQQLESMMDVIDREPNAHEAWEKFQKKRNRKNRFSKQWMKVAAVFAGVIVMTGITFATIHIVRIKHQTSLELPAPNAQPSTIGSRLLEPVRFNNISLDSILTVVAAHYKKSVTFRDEASRRMKLIMTWQPDTSLDQFLDRLNAFDGLHLELKKDTIVVSALVELNDK
jgi:hypothetical protein